MVRLPSTPVLSRVGFTKDELERIAGKLKIDAWLMLSLVELLDEPKFEYRLGEVDFISLFPTPRRDNKRLPCFAFCLTRRGRR